jgi:hypothetical protein
MTQRTYFRLFVIRNGTRLCNAFILSAASSDTLASHSWSGMLPFFFCIPGTNSCASSSFQNRPCITVSRSHVPSPTVATLHLPGPYLISGGCTAMICPAFSGCECPRSGAVSLRSFGDGCYSV